MLNSIMKMNEKLATQKIPRIRFLKTFIKPQSSTCPECDSELTVDDDEIYCPKCGLVTSASYDYVAGVKITFPYGKK